MSMKNFVAALLLGSDKRDSKRRLKGFFEPTDVILDVGSLDAPYTLHLPNKVVAIDIPPIGIFGYTDDCLKKLAAVRPNFEPMYANAENMPFEDSRFDRIICTEVMEHVERDDFVAKEIARVLKRDGRAYITTPNGDVLPLEKGIEEHLRHYTKKQFYDLFVAHFEEIEQDTRFKSFRLMCLQYELSNSWADSKWKIWNLAAFCVVLGLCEIMIRLEGFFPGEGYNQVIVCRKPIKQA